VRFTLEHENEKLQQQLAAAVVTEQSLTTQLQVSTTTYTCEKYQTYFVEHTHAYGSFL
jgi:chorismate-pyruvate lyase